MTIECFTVEVQPDFLARQSKAEAVNAVAELIWNGLDADATAVDVRVDYNELGMTKIAVADNGTGIPRPDAPQLFTRLGGSWKKPGAPTKGKGRMLHGSEGRGRFKAFALGRVADWHVTYDADGQRRSYTISILEENLREVRISDEKPSLATTTGVQVTVSELHKQFRSLESEGTSQEFAEIFALYLKDYRDVIITIDGVAVDPSSAIVNATVIELPPVVDDEASTPHPVALELVEWRIATKRALYLCNEQGFPLSQVASHFHVGDFQFSAYLKSTFVTRLHHNAQLELAEMEPRLAGAIEHAKQEIKAYFRDRAATRAQSVVEEWKAERVYPYEGEAKNPIEAVERKVFDIVAVTASDYMPDFEASPTQQKAMHLHMLRSAIERSPEDLQLILKEVLKLPKRKQEELAKLLREASLSAIISAAKIVADRLKFLSGLETLIFDVELKKHLKERSQLHRILAENTWIFGEEFNLSADDQSLTSVLRKHAKLLKQEIVVDTPVRRIDDSSGIVDLMLSRAIRPHRRDELEHLVVELKAPRVKIGSDETTQIKSYAFAVARDERFRSVKTRWSFWVISNEMDDFVRQEVRIANLPEGVLYRPDDGSMTIWVKTWAQVIEENRTRLQFFQEKLEHQVDQGTALKHLQERYQEILQGLVTKEDVARLSEKAQDERG
jgi:hypothetical protein